MYIKINFKKALGKILKEKRKENKFTQNEIAEIINISQEQYSKYERGINDISAEKLYHLNLLYKTDILKIIYENTNNLLFENNISLKL